MEASCAVLVGLPGGGGRVMVEPEPAGLQPVSGDAAAIAEQLAGFGAAGAAEVQLVVDPIVPASIESLGEVLRILRAAAPGTTGHRVTA